MRFVNQLESGTSPSVLTLTAGRATAIRFAERVVDEVVALREIVLRDRRDVAHVVVEPHRIVRKEAP